MNTGTKELKSILEELDELKLPHMAAELEDLYNLIIPWRQSRLFC